MRTWVVLTGVCLALAGFLLILATAMTLANLGVVHDAECGPPTSAPSSETCQFLASSIHAWQGLEFIGILAAGTGVGVLLVEYIPSRPRTARFERRIPAFRRREIRERQRHRSRHAAP